jgi:hypothetical protein
LGRDFQDVTVQSHETWRILEGNSGVRHVRVPFLQE